MRSLEIIKFREFTSTNSKMFLLLVVFFMLTTPVIAQEDDPFDTTGMTSDEVAEVVKQISDEDLEDGITVCVSRTLFIDAPVGIEEDEFVDTVVGLNTGMLAMAFFQYYPFLPEPTFIEGSGFCLERDDDPFNVYISMLVSQVSPGSVAEATFGTYVNNFDMVDGERVYEVPDITRTMRVGEGRFSYLLTSLLAGNYSFDEIQVLFDEGEYDSLPQEVKWFIFVLAHELGHIFSMDHLGQQSDGSLPVMYYQAPAVSGDFPEVLTSADIEAFQEANPDFTFPEE